MGRTITRSFRVNWKKDLFNIISEISEYAENYSSEPIPFSKLSIRSNKDMVYLFELLNITKNIARTQKGKKRAQGLYELGEEGLYIFDLFQKLNIESNIEIRINKHLHKLLIDSFFHYEFFLNFLRYFIFNSTSNESFTKGDLYRNLLMYCIREVGTTGIMDQHTLNNLMNFAKGVELIIEDQEEANSLTLNLDFFDDLNYGDLNNEIEKKLENYREGMNTIDLCRHLLEYQTHFYLGTDLTLSEIYDCLKYLARGEDPSIRCKFEFIGGITYPPIIGAHALIKLKK